MTKPFETLQPDEGTRFPTIIEMRRQAYALLAPLPFDTLVTYEQFAAVLHLNPMLDQRARTAVLKAGRDLLREDNKKLVNVKMQGYRIIRPNEHVGVSQQQQRRARRLLREGLQTVTHIALDHLAPTEVAAVMVEQARTGLQLAMTTRLARAKQLPPRKELHLPSTAKLVDMMRKRRA